MTIRLLIVDDHRVVCSGVRALLSDTQIEVIECATNSGEAIRAFDELKPDVVLLDVILGNSSGFDLYESLRQRSPSVPIIFYSGFDNPKFVARAASLEAAGYLIKTSDRNTLIEAIESAAAGRPTRVRRPAFRSGASNENVDIRVEVALTEREQQVLEKLADGLTNKQIAQALSISYETVKEHVQHILQKIGVTDRTQAAVWAVRRGLI